MQTLFHRGKKGELRTWRIWTEDDLVKTEYGLVDGAKTQSSYKCTPKNVGKKNETSSQQQAEKEAEAEWKHKLDLKYSLTQEEASQPMEIPMLAKEYKGKKSVEGWYAQPKLDGVRALAYWKDGHVVLQSRGCKFYTIPTHIIEELEKWLPKDSMLDGELYIHGLSCQQITSLVKSKKDDTPKVQYWVYDYPVVEGDESLNYNHRREALFNLFGLDHFAIDDPLIRFVQTRHISDVNELNEYEQKKVKEGYEGIMLRDSNSLYQFGYRSDGLLKLKRFEDAEFEVVDAYPGVGKFEKLCLYQCKNNTNDLLFEVAAPGSFEERAQQLIDKDNYIGRKLTIKFQGRTDSDLPRFPIGKLFRAKDDLDNE